MRMWALSVLMTAAACASGESTRGGAAAGAAQGGGADGAVGGGGHVLDRPDGEAASADAGASDIAAADPDVAVEPPCPSGVKWTWGNEGDPMMNPGQACVACHTSDPEAPQLLFGGTVFTALHTQDNCNSQATDAGPITVEITGSDGKVLTAKVNAAGNFYVKTGAKALVPPYNARVLQGDKVREMYGQQTIGDCNSCHTQAGDNGAPGRIMAPN